jgi:hypothetical protein
VRPSLLPWAVVLAALGTLVHASDAPLWATDAALLGADEAGAWTGQVSRALAGILRVLPLGSLTLRSTLLGAIASGLCAGLLWQLSVELMAEGRSRPRIDAWLSLAAALGVVFALPWMTDATVAAGGAAPRVVPGLLLWVLLVRQKRVTEGLGAHPMVLGALFGLCIGESPWIGLAVFVIGLAKSPFDSRPKAALFFASAAAVTLAVFAPALLTASVEDVYELSVWPLGGAFPGLGPIAFVRDVGLLASAGVLLFALPGGPGRSLWLPSGVVLLFDVLIPASPAGPALGAVDGCAARSALHLMMLATMAPLGALGLRRLLDIALELRVLAAGQSAALLTVLALAVSSAGLEDAHRYLSQTDVSGARAWTSAALDELPLGALVLTRSEPVGRRLRAAQVQGERPDVLILRLDRLSRPRTLAHALRAEPALEPLIVDLSLGQPPSERALAVLVDRRPVYVEPGPGWEPRLLQHIEPALPLAAFSPYPLAHSDRLANLDQRKARIERVLEATERGVRPDRATQRVLATGAQQLLSMLDEVGDESAGEAFFAGGLREKLMQHHAELHRASGETAAERVAAR